MPSKLLPVCFYRNCSLCLYLHVTGLVVNLAGGRHCYSCLVTCVPGISDRLARRHSNFASVWRFEWLRLCRNRWSCLYPHNVASSNVPPLLVSPVPLVPRVQAIVKKVIVSCYISMAAQAKHLPKIMHVQANIEYKMLPPLIANTVNVLPTLMIKYNQSFTGNLLRQPSHLQIGRGKQPEKNLHSHMTRETVDKKNSGYLAKLSHQCASVGASLHKRLFVSAKRIRLVCRLFTVIKLRARRLLELLLVRLSSPIFVENLHQALMRLSLRHKVFVKYHDLLLHIVLS